MDIRITIRQRGNRTDTAAIFPKTSDRMGAKQCWCCTDTCSGYLWEKLPLAAVVPATSIPCLYCYSLWSVWPQENPGTGHSVSQDRPECPGLCTENLPPLSVAPKLRPPFRCCASVNAKVLRSSSEFSIRICS